MATSLAEAFKQAQAIQSQRKKATIPVLTGAAAEAPTNAQATNLWSQETSGVKPLLVSNDENLTVESLAGPVATATPSLDKRLARATGRTNAKPEAAGKPKKARNANLDEYRQRAAAVAVSQKSMGQSAPRYLHLRPTRNASVMDAPVDQDRVSLTVHPNAKVAWDDKTAFAAPLLKHDLGLGAQTQISTEPRGKRDVVLGFDFGTSSAKVVVGDRDLKKAHAVPFRNALGIDTYLLPATLYEENGSFSLHAGTRSFDDLKLALLADHNDPNLQCRIVAYLALVIREARAWLFAANAEDYTGTEIVWTLALGLPASHLVGNSLGEVFQRLGVAAWAVAGSQLDISAITCREALAAATSKPDDEAVDVTVTPEIAAQVYGFVNSRSFDDKARNFFLIADVGAGTVDTCLFRVSRAKGGRWSFEICTSAVEFAGVMNLHRNRITWWQQQLAANASSNASLHNELEKIKLATSTQTVIPSSYRTYLEGVTVAFSGKAEDPDAQFFRAPLLQQVQGSTLYRAVGDRLVGKQDVIDIPFFLCGGGSRLAFYQNLRAALRRVEGCTWLRAHDQELVIPAELRADGVGRSDYDRLSVAYGLSMLSLAGLSTMPQLPRLPEDSPPEQWRSHYVDKDEC